MSTSLYRKSTANEKRASWLQPQPGKSQRQRKSLLEPDCGHLQRRTFLTCSGSRASSGAERGCWEVGWKQRQRHRQGGSSGPRPSSHAEVFGLESRLDTNNDSSFMTLDCWDASCSSIAGRPLAIKPPYLICGFWSLVFSAVLWVLAHELDKTQHCCTLHSENITDWGLQT